MPRLLGACSAFAATAPLEALNARAGQPPATLSPLFFYYAERQHMQDDMGETAAVERDTGAYPSEDDYGDCWTLE